MDACKHPNLRFNKCIWAIRDCTGLLFVWPFSYWPIKCNETEMESVGCDGPVTMTAFNARWFPSVEHTHTHIEHVLKWRFSNVTTHYWPFIILSSICEKEISVCATKWNRAYQSWGEKKNRKRNMETAIKKANKTVSNKLRHTRVSRVTLFWFLFHILLKLSTFVWESSIRCAHRLNIHMNHWLACFNAGTTAKQWKPKPINKRVS